MEPFSQDLKLTAPWAVVTRVQAPEGWQFDWMVFCHNTHNLLDTAAKSRERVHGDGYTLRGVYIAASVIEIPTHQYGFTTPR